MTICDVKGYPIFPGDVLRSFHFKGCGRKNHYLYHVATIDDDNRLWAIPAQYLSPDVKRTGGDCLLTESLVQNHEIEIVQGQPTRHYICKHDRPRKGKK